MKYVRLGRTGLKVSNICLGTMQFGWTADEATGHAIMSRAVELGCNFIDTADIYSTWVEGNPGGVSEEIIGTWLSSGAVQRNQIVLATKVRGIMGKGPNDSGLSRGHIMDAVDASLRRLQTDYIDLYQVHAYDPDTPLAETMEALNDLVRSGKVRYIGCSNFTASQLTHSLWLSDKNGWARFESIQPHHSMAHRAEFERELQSVCVAHGVGVIPYSPLAGGFLTGKYRRDGELPSSPRAGGIQEKYLNDTGYAVIEKLEEIGRNHNATVAQIAIAWLLANPAITAPIVGANTIAQLEDTVKGAEVEISAEEKASLDELTAWHPDNKGPGW